ncbi:MAG: hypothetical protein ACLTFJ_02885 [Clostridium sp.]
MAEKLGISRSYVSRIEKRAVGHMRRRSMSPPGRPCDTFRRRFLREGSLGMIRTEREVLCSSGFLPGTRDPEADHRERSCRGTHSLRKSG